MDHVDSKFIGLLSSRLEKFKKVKSGLYNFRCPLCGDSQKNKYKTRGYLYAIKTDINFRCHNCGASMSFNNFVKKIDGSLYKQYTLEKFKGGLSTKKIAAKDEPTFNFETPKFKTQIKRPLCVEAKRGREYLTKRGLDPQRFYWAEKFTEYVNEIKPTFGENVQEEPRIIIPLFYNKDLVGFQGRSLSSGSVKYITIMLYDDAPKIYGLDDIRKEERVFITEGPFDSTFIRNSIAMCGADADVSRWGISNPVWIYDNEPRSAEICRRIQTVIATKQTVVIWPDHIQQKDINDMYLAGHDVQNLVESNVYNGLEATLKFKTWKRI